MDDQWKQDVDEMLQLAEINMWALTLALPEGEELSEDLLDMDVVFVPWYEYEQMEYDTVPAILKREEGWD